MANLQEIKSRINSIRDTKKVTGAMYMISSIKMRRAMREVEQTKPFFRALKAEIGHVFRCIPDLKNPFFLHRKHPDGSSSRCGLLVVTADRGLAGSYNHDAIRMTEAFLKERPETVLYVVGEYGRQYFQRKGIPICESFRYSAEKPSVWTAQCICTEILDSYLDRTLDEVHIIYTDYKSGMTSECKTNCLLPLDTSRFKDEDRAEGAREECEFYPDPDTVLNLIVPSYLTGFIYASLTDSFCSEQHARMTAMDAAGRNADEMLRSLSVQYNSVRQAAITREITEISAGARALKNHRAMQQRLQARSQAAGGKDENP